jgi:hypothetical protein
MRDGQVQPLGYGNGQEKEMQLPPPVLCQETRDLGMVALTLGRCVSGAGNDTSGLTRLDNGGRENGHKAEVLHLTRAHTKRVARQAARQNRHTLCKVRLGRRSDDSEGPHKHTRTTVVGRRAFGRIGFICAKLISGPLCTFLLLSPVPVHTPRPDSHPNQSRSRAHSVLPRPGPSSLSFLSFGRVAPLLRRVRKLPSARHPTLALA